ncbi:hypothetical protein [Candidatus Accumulibacter aalborgensis]|nr:hypothetical protein [Candidatus Accumulibacter aalborgensis]
MRNRQQRLALVDGPLPAPACRTTSLAGGMTSSCASLPGGQN